MATSNGTSSGCLSGIRLQQSRNGAAARPRAWHRELAVGALLSLTMAGTGCMRLEEFLEGHQFHHRDAGSGVAGAGMAEDAATPPPPPEDAGTVCQPACTGRSCGSDGCGGQCSPGCAADETC